ncbi:MAG: di-heme oxidoredictase family protein [Aestuariivirga sp.]
MRLVRYLLVGVCLIPSLGRADDVPWSDRHLAHSYTFDEALAMSKADLNKLLDRGQELFTTKFTIEDGAGRPKSTQAIVPTTRKRGVNAQFQRTGGPDSTSCQACHSEPVVGAAGDFAANAFVSEGFEIADFDTVDPQFSSERNPLSLKGDGLVELLSREMTADLHQERSAALKQAHETGKDVTIKLLTKGVDYGELTVKPDGVVDISRLQGIDTDLVIRPFSRKGVFTSLRQFTVNALNAHFGIQAVERFGVRWTGTNDFDGDGVPDEIQAGDISAIALWLAALSPPTTRNDLPDDWQQAAAVGAKAFKTMECDSCHMTSLPLKSLVFTDPGPDDAAGTMRAADVKEPITVDLGKQPWAAGLKRNDKGEVLVPLFSDLKRHEMVDDGVSTLGNEILSQRFVDSSVFMTPELWGVGSTAPYGHRGNFTTLDGIIRAHGGEARDARDAYVKADDATRSAITAYLKTLVITK